jgi:transposase
MDDAPATSLPNDLPDDPALLKRIILDLSRQRDQQQIRLAELHKQHEAQLAELELEKLRLQHQLALLAKRCYGPRADRVDLGQLLLGFAEQLESRPVDEQDLPPGSQDADADRKSLRRVRRGRRDLAAFDRLPLVRCEHDLAEEHKPCPCCGQVRQRIGQESSWQVEYVPGHFHRVEHVRYKYACRHCEQEALAPQITLAEKPAAPIDKGMAGPGLLAYVATSKFADYLPLYRLEGIFARNGLEVDRSTMCLWMKDVADLVQPLYRLMAARVRMSHVLATDDTVMPMLAAGKAKQARMWIYVGDEHHPYNVFDFTEGRSRDGPAVFLGDYRQVLLADAYGGYDGICIEKQIVQAGCWAHARRKFVDTRELDPSAADELLALIRSLFAVEEHGRDLSAADRLKLRQERSAPVIERLGQRLAHHKQRLLPRHPVAGAISYVMNQWRPLTAFLADGAIPIGRVEVWRGGLGGDISVSRPFRLPVPHEPRRAPFPHPAHRTGRAALPHPALIRSIRPSRSAWLRGSRAA